MKKRIIPSVLAFIMGFSCLLSTGCKGFFGGESASESVGSSESVSSSETSNVSSSDSFFESIFDSSVDSSIDSSTDSSADDSSETEKEFEESGFNLVENGVSNYVVVIPEASDRNLNFAATEINNFIKEASSVDVGAVMDSNFKGDSKYISLGNTNLLEKTDIVVEEALGETGHFIKTIDGNVYVTGNTSYGVLFGTYDLLKYLIDLEIYAEDEYAYEEMDTIPVYNFEETFIPLIDSRHISYPSPEDSYIYRARMGLHNLNEEWIAFCHTVISVFLPTDKYAAKHPDWYNAMQDQLCYSNEEMRKEFVNRLKEEITRHPTRNYVSIGQEDNMNYCNCEKCTAYIDSHGGFDNGGFSALQLEFVNKCAEETDAWLAQAFPGRTVKYVNFAYQTTEAAPVVYNAETMRYEPNSPDIRVYKNVYIFFCPIYADFSLSMKDEANYSTYNNMVKWNNMLEACNVPENLMIYTYCIACKALMIPFPNFGMSHDHYETFAELGAKYVFDQNYNAAGLAPFEGLKVYTQSREMMYEDCDYNALAKDYIDHYYGEARVPMNNFYNSLRAWLLYLQQNKDYLGKISFNTCQEEFWPIDVLQKFIGYIDEGFEAIEPLKSTNPERYQVLYDRLKREKLFPQWLMFYFYQGYMDYDTQVEYINDLEVYTTMYGITHSAEGVKNVESIIAGWKTAIGG